MIYFGTVETSCALDAAGLSTGGIIWPGKIPALVIPKGLSGVTKKREAIRKV